MDEVVDHSNDGSNWPAAVEEEVEQLQWKKDLTICNGRRSWPAATEEII